MLEKKFTYFDTTDIEGFSNLCPEAIGINWPRSEVIETSRGIPAMRMTIFHSPVVFITPELSFDITPETLIVIPANIPTAYGMEGQRWTHSWLRLGGKDSCRFQQKFNLPELIPLPLADAEACIQKLWLLHQEMQNPSGTDVNIVESLLDIWGNELRRQTGAGSKNVLPDSLRQSLSYIQSNFHSQITLEDIASAGNISRQHLCDIFRRNLGQTPFGYCISLRLKHARELLSTTAWPVHQIAMECGFNSIYYFSKLFREKVGVTPTSYRLSRQTAPEIIKGAEQDRKTK